MKIFGLEKGLGAQYGAKKIEDNELVYGLAVIKVDDEKSYLIRLFETNDFTDGAPALAHYVAVKTNSVHLLEDDDEEDNDECDKCICYTCEHRVGHIPYEHKCLGKCFDCNREPLDKCFTNIKSS